MRFLVDENLPSVVSELLERQGHNVLHLSKSSHRGANDAEVWQLAVREERIIVTRDLDFPLPVTPRPPGLVLLRLPDTFTKEHISRVMSDFIASDAFDRVADAITVVSPGRIRSRTF